MKSKAIHKLLQTEEEQLKKYSDIVAQSIREQQLIVETLRKPKKEKLTRQQRISELVANFGGSWHFVAYFMIVLGIWILYNSMAAGKAQFDPYPFIFMNLILSCISAIQAPFILMSQNRKEEKDRQRDENDYLINLKAEEQVRTMQQKIDLLVGEQLSTLYNLQANQLKLLEEIRENLKGK